MTAGGTDCTTSRRRSRDLGSEAVPARSGPPPGPPLGDGPFPVGDGERRSEDQSETTAAPPTMRTGTFRNRVVASSRVACISRVDLNGGAAWDRDASSITRESDPVSECPG